MGNQATETTEAAKTVPSEPEQGSIWHGWQHMWHVVAIVLLPLLLLIVVITATLAFIGLVRSWTVSDPFFVQQQYVLLVASIGLILAALLYTLSILYGWRKIRAWHEINHTRKAIGATWGLGATAILLSMPLLIAFFVH